MSEPAVHELNLSASRAEAVAAIREVFPEDTIVRDEDDAIGRFASERVVMVVHRGNKKLDLWRGGWRMVRERENDPQVTVELDDAGDGVTARFVERPEKPPGLGARAMNAVGNMVTVAAVVVAYYMFRDLEMDVPMVAAIGVGGGLLWSIVAHFLPERREENLGKQVRDALGPLRAPKQPSSPSPESDPPAKTDGGDQP